MTGAAQWELRRVLAPNPGPMTGPGTNTYVLVAGGEAIVIDPGPVIDSHCDAILRAIGEASTVAVVVTHTHPDHAPLANPLAAQLGAPAVGFAAGPDFVPDRTIGDGELVEWGGASMTAIHTPGHTPDHLCYSLGDVLFTGDHIMSGSTVIIEDLRDYMRSLRRVRALEPATIYPGHGDRIDDAVGVIDGYVVHREERERQVMHAVAAGARTVDAITDLVYAGLDGTLRPAAALQTLTQLRKLEAEGRVRLSQGKAGTQPTVRLSGEAGT